MANSDSESTDNSGPKRKAASRVKSDAWDPSNPNAAKIPSHDQRMPTQLWLRAPHPATLPLPQLLQQCELRTQRRSGPGGQHRNKTSSAAFLLHRPTGVVAEATERRSQAQNRDVALERLRYRLAVDVRCVSAFDESADGLEAEYRNHYEGKLQRMGEANPAKPAVLALLLNDLHACGGQPSLVAKKWKTSTSMIVRLVRSMPTAFLLLNQIRQHHDRPPLH